MAARIARGLHLHFDPCSGVAGDMTVAALVGYYLGRLFRR